MRRQKKEFIAKQINKITFYLGSEVPRDPSYGLEPNCNIQWDMVHEYRDSTLCLLYHSVGTHTYDYEMKTGGFVITWNARAWYREKEVFSSQDDSYSHHPPYYVTGRWEGKLRKLCERVLKEKNRRKRQDAKQK